MCDPYPLTVTAPRSIPTMERGRARPTVFQWMPTEIGLLVSRYSFAGISRVKGLTMEKQGHEA